VIAVPAAKMLPYYEKLQRQWTAADAADFLNKMISPASPLNGPWAFKDCGAGR